MDPTWHGCVDVFKRMDLHAHAVSIPGHITVARLDVTRTACMPGRTAVAVRAKKKKKKNTALRLTHPDTMITAYAS